MAMDYYSTTRKESRQGALKRFSEGERILKNAKRKQNDVFLHQFGSKTRRFML